MAETFHLNTLICDFVSVLLSAPANAFILLVSLREVPDSQSLPINDQLTFGIGLSNVLHQVVFILQDLLVLGNREILSSKAFRTCLGTLNLAFTSCSIWFATLLSICFCLEIVNIKQKLYNTVQKTFPKIFHRFLCVIVAGSLVLSFFSFSWSSDHGFSNNSLGDDHGHQVAITMNDRHVHSEVVIGTLFSVSFVVFLLSTGIITCSICRQGSNTEASTDPSRVISVHAHSHIMETVLLLLTSSILRTITEVDWIFSTFFSFPEDAAAVISTLHHVSTPFILIKANRKLEKVFKKCFHRCPCFKVSDI